MDGVGRRRRPAGRDRSGLTPLITASRASAGTRTDWVAAAAGSASPPREARAPCRSHPPPFPARSAARFRLTSAVRLRFRGRCRFIDDGRRDRRASRSGSWRCWVRTAGYPLPARRSCRRVAAAGSGVAAMAAIFISALATGVSVAAAAGGRRGRCLRALLLGRFFRLCRFDLGRLCRRQRRQFLRLGRTGVRGVTGRSRGVSGCFRIGGGDILVGFSATADRRAAAPVSAAGLGEAGKHRLGRRPSRR